MIDHGVAPDRLSIRSPQFAEHLFNILRPHLPPLPLPASMTQKPNVSADPHSLHSNIRLYRYSEGEYFGRHYDDSVKDPETGAQSEWTLLIYLTGEAQGVVGGQVRLILDGVFRIQTCLFLRLCFTEKNGANQLKRLQHH